MNPSSFEVILSFKGRASTVPVCQETTVDQLEEAARNSFALDEDTPLRLLYKGKVLGPKNEVAFPHGGAKKPQRIMVMASSNEQVKKLNAGRSDPTIRGFNNEKQTPQKTVDLYWGTDQDKKYRFTRLEACTWQSFGHRTGSTTPHAFEALRLLEKLATDPGVVAVMVERELVVNTLGEMDPIDDRIMKKKQTEGGCLLGYNTNNGLRIDLKLRTNDLTCFLPYHQIAATLIHELSHNWVAEHNVLFWTNYGQMRVEYLHKHATLASTGYIVQGKTTAQLAGIAQECKDGIASIEKSVIQDCSREMRQHGIPVQAIAPAIADRCREIEVKSQQSERGQKLGGSSSFQESNGGKSTREYALAAAERRARGRENEKKENR